MADDAPARKRKGIDPRLVDMDNPHDVLLLRRQKSSSIAPEVAFDQFAESRRDLNMSERTEANYRKILSLLARYLKRQGRADIWDVTSEDLEDWLRQQRKQPSEQTGATRSAYTVRNYAKHVLACWHWLEDRGIVPPQASHGFRVPRIRPEDEVEPHTFVDEEVTRLFEVCELDGEEGQEQMALAQRNRALLAVLLDTGCRMGELVSMRVEGLENLDSDDPRARVYQSKTRVRWIALSVPSARHLKKYLTMGRRWLAEVQRDPDVRAESGPLWLGRDGRPLLHAGVEKLFQRLEKRVGAFTYGECSPHVCRRWYITRALGNGVLATDVAKQCGTSVAVILKYYESSTVRELLHRVRQGAPYAQLQREQLLRQNPRGGRSARGDTYSDG